MECWVDKIGDRLEKEGVDSGRIFEFWIPLNPELSPHGVMVTSEKLSPGRLPTHPWDIERVVVQKKVGMDGGPEDIEMPGNRGLVVAKFWHILEDIA